MALIKPAFYASALNVARWSAVVMCLSLATSRSLFMMAAGSLILATALSGQWAIKLGRLVDRPAALWIVALTAWIYITSLWSAGNPQTIAYAANVHWKLILIPFLVMVIDSPEWARRCWNAYVIGVAILLVHLFTLEWVSLPWVSVEHTAGVFFNPLPQAVALALFAAWCLYEGLLKGVGGLRKGLLFSGFFAGTYAVFFISIQRLGYLSWLLACGLVLFMTLSKRMRWWAFLALVASAVSIAGNNAVVQERVSLAYQEVKGYNFENNYSSVGSRLHMWYVSAQAIQESPIIGRGLGSYPVLAKAAFNDAAMCEMGCMHPHNQYVFYALEFGLIGLAFFGLALLSAFRRLWPPDKDKTLPLVALVVFVMCGFFETTLWYRGFFYLFVTLLGLVIALPSLSGSNNRLAPRKQF